MATRSPSVSGDTTENATTLHSALLGGAAVHPPALLPAYTSVEGWGSLSGMGRRSIYDALGRGHLKAIKCGAKTLIDVAHGLAWLSSLPPAKIRAPRERKAA